MPGFKRISDLALAGTLTGTELLEVSQLSTTVRISAATLSALASDNSYNDSAAGFVAAGFVVGDRVNVTGFTGNVANNILVGVVTALTTTKMTIGGTDGDVIVDDAAGETVVISKWLSRRITSANIASLASSAGASVNAQTGTSYTLVLTDANDVVTMSNAAANVLTIPTDAAVAFPVGTVISIIQLGAGGTTVDADVGVTLNGISSGGALLTAQHSAVSIVKIAANTWNIAGNHGVVA